ncbi:MAG: hypothetical protein P0Y66_22055 [Candidatus Kaistia colombiensis]|nr:MAG: hypothetical protein P0Y66_22055 [Kaistia sp.]
MSMITIVSSTMVAAAVAFILERAISAYCRIVRFDAGRIRAAVESQTEQADLLQEIAIRETIPLDVKDFLLDVAEISLDHSVAVRLLDGIESEERRADDARGLEIAQAIADVGKVDPKALELITGFLRVSMLASFLQWPDTAKRLLLISPRLAAERADEMVSSAAGAMRRPRTSDEGFRTPAFV